LATTSLQWIHILMMDRTPPPTHTHTKKPQYPNPKPRHRHRIGGGETRRIYIYKHIYTYIHNVYRPIYLLDGLERVDGHEEDAPGGGRARGGGGLDC
jgi:hypothetical protein